MKSFPDKLKPQNKSSFGEYKFNRDLCKLRQRIVDYLYSGDKTGFDLKLSQGDNNQYNYSHIDTRLVEVVTEELKSLGWKTKVAYGNTTLFIYTDNEELPVISDIETIE